MAGTNRLSVVEDRSIFVETWCLHTVDCLCTVKVGEHQHYWFIIIIIIIFMLCICNVRRKSDCLLSGDILSAHIWRHQDVGWEIHRERYRTSSPYCERYSCSAFSYAVHTCAIQVLYKFCAKFVQNLCKTCTIRGAIQLLQVGQWASIMIMSSPTKSNIYGILKQIIEV